MINVFHRKSEAEELLKESVSVIGTLSLLNNLLGGTDDDDYVIQIHVRDGKLHNDNGPAIKISNAYKLPTCIYEIILGRDSQSYYHSPYDNVYGAMEYLDKTIMCYEAWYKDGKLNREGGPAVKTMYDITFDGIDIMYREDHFIDGVKSHTRDYYCKDEGLQFEDDVLSTLLEAFEKIEDVETRTKLLQIAKEDE